MVFLCESEWIPALLHLTMRRDVTLVLLNGRCKQALDAIARG